MKQTHILALNYLWKKSCLWSQNGRTTLQCKNKASSAFFFPWRQQICKHPDFQFSFYENNSSMLLQGYIIKKIYCMCKQSACETFQNICLKQSCLVWQSFKCQEIVLNAKSSSESDELKGSWMGLNLDKVQHFFVSRWQSTHPRFLSRFSKCCLGTVHWEAFWSNAYILHKVKYTR